MAAASASTAPPMGETPPAPFAPGPPPPIPLPSAARPRPRFREVTSRYLSTPLPAHQAPRFSASSPHSASVVPPSPRAHHHHHHHRGTPAAAPFVFGLADENRPPPTPGSRKRGAAPDLFDAMHHPRRGLNPPATPLAAAGASRAATAAPSPRRILHTSRASANVATTALQDRSGCSGRPATPARTSFSFRSASPEPSLASTPYPRHVPRSEVRSSLQMTEGSRGPQNPFCFRALDLALSDCQPTLSRALMKPPQPRAQKVGMVKKGALMGSNKAVGKQEGVHRLRILDNCNMHYRFLNARAEAVAVAKNAAAEESLFELSERIAGLQKGVAEKKAELERLKRVEVVHYVVGAQMPILEQWSEYETEHFSCLERGTSALREASSRVSTSGDIRIDIGGINATLKSAMKILEELSPVEKFSRNVEEIEDVASNLSELVGSEQLLLEECAGLLHQALNMQVMENGLRIQLLDMKSEAKNKT